VPFIAADPISVYMADWPLVAICRLASIWVARETEQHWVTSKL
jgi:hypothetical protein